MTIKRLSNRQQQVLDFIITYITRYGYPPTLREIGSELGVTSTNSVYEHLRALEKKGYVERRPGAPRAITVVG